MDGPDISAGSTAGDRAASAPGPVRHRRRYRAAGGVVLDETGRVLVLERWIDRQGRPTFEVRLPKGHVEPGETDEEAALREVCEESGVCGLEVVADLGSFTSEFILRDEQVIRDEHYYLMRLPPAHEPLAVRSPEPQSAAEALFERKWLPDLAEAESAITFASEQEFVRRARAVVDRSPHLAS